MNGRGGYVAALVAAVLVLVGSVIAVVAFTATSGSLAMHRANQSIGADDGWRQGLAGSGMMGPDTAGSNQYRGMMGRSGGGMMGNWNDNSTATISSAQAKTAADAWVAANQRGASAGEGLAMPMGYIFIVSKDGQQIGRVIVNDDTGAVAWLPYSVGPTTAPSAS